jgi:hypothetical protein
LAAFTLIILFEGNVENFSEYYFQRTTICEGKYRMFGILRNIPFPEGYMLKLALYYSMN